MWWNHSHFCRRQLIKIRGVSFIVRATGGRVWRAGRVEQVDTWRGKSSCISTDGMDTDARIVQTQPLSLLTTTPTYITEIEIIIEKALLSGVVFSSVHKLLIMVISRVLSYLSVILMVPEPSSRSPRNTRQSGCSTNSSLPANCPATAIDVILTYSTTTRSIVARNGGSSVINIHKIKCCWRTQIVTSSGCMYVLQRI